jgi:Putative phage metallopeptidase
MLSLIDTRRAGMPDVPSDLTEEVLTREHGIFRPSPEWAEWLYDTFIREGAPLENEEHAHLQNANIGVLLTNLVHRKQGWVTLGTAELVTMNGDPWKTGRKAQQIREWFGVDPDFIVTLFAPFLAQENARRVCRLAEHELLHCGWARWPDGELRVTDEGGPVYGLRRHDVEEFVSIAQRYGVEGMHQSAALFVDAALRDPTVSDEMIRRGCGACRAA